MVIQAKNGQNDQLLLGNQPSLKLWRTGWQLEVGYWTLKKYRETGTKNIKASRLVCDCHFDPGDGNPGLYPDPVRQTKDR